MRFSQWVVIFILSYTPKNALTFFTTDSITRNFIPPKAGLENLPYEVSVVGISVFEIPYQNSSLAFAF